MQSILSIQSHVAYGYVGNKAAVLPLQCLGFDVVDINTVQFSNHTGYGSWTGEVVPPEQINRLIAGLRDRGALVNARALLTGYMGDTALGAIMMDTLNEIRRLQPSAVYCCDPVMGDTGRGFFVRPGIPEFFRDVALPVSTIITPNLFELNWLSGMDVRTLDQALEAARKLRATGPNVVLVTSLECRETPEGMIQMLAASDTDAFLVTTPKLNISVNGAGDCTSALFLGHYLKSGNLRDCLELTAGAIWRLFENTAARQSREIALVQSIQDFLSPDRPFTAEKIA